MYKHGSIWFNAQVFKSIHSKDHPRMLSLYGSWLWDNQFCYPIKSYPLFYQQINIWLHNTFHIIRQQPWRTLRAATIFPVQPRNDFKNPKHGEVGGERVTEDVTKKRFLSTESKFLIGIIVAIMEAKKKLLEKAIGVWDWTKASENWRERHLEGRGEEHWPTRVLFCPSGFGCLCLWSRPQDEANGLDSIV